MLNTFCNTGCLASIRKGQGASTWETRADGSCLFVLVSGVGTEKKCEDIANSVLDAVRIGSDDPEKRICDAFLTVENKLEKAGKKLNFLVGLTCGKTLVVLRIGEVRLLRSRLEHLDDITSPDFTVQGTHKLNIRVEIFRDSFEEGDTILVCPKEIWQRIGEESFSDRSGEEAPDRRITSFLKKLDLDEDSVTLLLLERPHIKKRTEILDSYSSVLEMRPKKTFRKKLLVCISVFAVVVLAVLFGLNIINFSQIQAFTGLGNNDQTRVLLVGEVELPGELSGESIRAGEPAGEEYIVPGFYSVQEFQSLETEHIDRILILRDTSRQAINEVRVYVRELNYFARGRVAVVNETGIHGGEMFLNPQSFALFVTGKDSDLGTNLIVDGEGTWELETESRKIESEDAGYNAILAGDRQ